MSRSVTFLMLLLMLLNATVNAQTVRDFVLYSQVSVKDDRFGAVGDNTTDDTAAIQAAFDYVRDQGGGLVKFPAGKFVLTDTLEIQDTDNIMIVGAGFESQIRQTGNGKDCLLISNSEWGCIRDIIIRGTPESGVGIRLDDTSSNWSV